MMASDRKLDLTISQWLQESAPTGLPQRVLAATFERTRGSRQQLGWQQLGWRGVLGRRGEPGRRPMPRLAPALGGAAVAVLAAILAINVVPILGPAATPTPAPTSSPTGPTTQMWPQATLDEVLAAQALVDAGNPQHEWQVDDDLGPQLGQHHPGSGASTSGGAEIFQRFLREKLGWDSYRWEEAFAHPDGLRTGEVVYLRCTAGAPNPLYPREPRGCEPTIDELRYETVRMTAARPARDGSGGIWVITGWMIDEPVAQEDPRSIEAQGRAILEDFLGARIDGSGAEGIAEIADPTGNELVDASIPLLYATTTGKLYERFELDFGDPQWPTGSMDVTVSLFAANDSTVVEQAFSLSRDDAGRVRLVYNPTPFTPAGAAPATTENGVAVPVTYRFLDGAVTFRAADPLGIGGEDTAVADGLAVAGILPGDDFPRRVLVLLADPRPIGPDCVAAEAPADAAALARSIESDAAFNITASAPVTIGGRPGLRLDVDMEPMSCGTIVKPHRAQPGLFSAQTRARIFLVDLPEGSTARILAIAIGADDDSFDTVLEAAEPVVASVEVHAP